MRGGRRSSTDRSTFVLKTELFDYNLPGELIAQHPAARRDESRLLVVHRAERRLEHRRFRDLPEYLTGEDLLVRNTARVLPARLFAKRPTGGAVECLLLHVQPGRAGVWTCLLRPGRRLKPGATFGLPGEFSARVLEKHEGGESTVEFRLERTAETVADLAERLGAVPLPPYIERAEATNHADHDRARYQTVFADEAKNVAVAAPTAGLHFTPELLSQLESQGVSFADVVLHVGLGTFRPMETDFVEEHQIHREIIEIGREAAARLSNTRGKRIVAVGTTSVRTVETWSRLAASGRDVTKGLMCETDLFLRPPDMVSSIGALITNFHLPRSTLLCLVAAVLTPGSTDGIAWLRAIYREAVREGYRFLSYGDAMLIV